MNIFVTNKQIAWLKMEAMDGNASTEPTVLTIHTQSVVKDQRFRVSHNSYRQWYLHIKSVRAQDKGTNIDPQSQYII